MTHFLVTKADFEAFLDTVNPYFTRTPNYGDSRIMASFKLDNGVRVNLTLTTLEVTPNGNFYGRHNTWTHVRLDRWIWNNVSKTGKGSRSDETHQKIWDIIGLLGEFDGWNGLRRFEGETVVNLVDTFEE